MLKSKETLSSGEGAGGAAGGFAFGGSAAGAPSFDPFQAATYGGNMAFN